MAKVTLGSLSRELNSVRDEISGLNAEMTDLKAKRDKLEQQLLDMLDDQELERASVGDFTVSVLKSIVPTVDDWDAFYEFMRKEDALYMLQRRPSPPAYREMLDAREGEAIPGVSSYEKRTIGLRTTKP